MTMDYYNMNGKAISSEEWARVFHYDRTVLATKFEAITFSTVWLGLDHNYSCKGPPLIFETMAFTESSEDRWNERCERYPSRQLAIIGHWSMVNEWLESDGKEDYPTVVDNVRNILKDLEVRSDG